jgi:hypothetical protein
MRRVLIRRSTSWRLTFIGWCIVLTVAVLASLLLASRAHDFLTVADRLEANAIVVPGMLPDIALLQIAREMEVDQELYVFTVGGRIGHGSFLSDFCDYANLAASSLSAMGADSARLVAIPSESKKTDRTYESALALREWLDQSDLPITSLNIYTFEARARRTGLLFSRALNPNFEVGIVTLRHPGYDPAAWWESSHGVRITISETIAYIYARFFFRPNQGGRRSNFKSGTQCDDRPNGD